MSDFLHLLKKNKKEVTYMVGIMKQNGQLTYNLMEYVVDTEDDIKSLPKGVAMGSTAFIIDTGDVVMLNGKKEWVKI